MDDKVFHAATFNSRERYRFAVIVSLIVDLFAFLLILLLPSPWFPKLKRAYWPTLSIILESYAPEAGRTNTEVPIIPTPVLPTPPEEKPNRPAPPADKPTAASAPAAATVSSPLLDKPDPSPPVPAPEREADILTAALEEPIPVTLGEIVIVASKRVLPLPPPELSDLLEPKPPLWEWPSVSQTPRAPPIDGEETDALRNLPLPEGNTSSPTAGSGETPTKEPSPRVEMGALGYPERGAIPTGLGAPGDELPAKRAGPGSGSGEIDATPHMDKPPAISASNLKVIIDARPLSPISVIYPFAARARGAEGTVEITALIAADGRLTSARVSLSSGDTYLDAAALAAVKLVNYRAATHDGVAVKSVLIVPFVFSLNE